MLEHRIKYRPDVDGLRAVAVLSVVFCHAKLGFSGGFIGVDVFFVISGFLITSLILKEVAADTFSFMTFWERRIRRIIPALLVVVICTLVAGHFLLMPDAYKSLGDSVVGLALLMSNVHFWMDTGYFAGAAELKPMLHTWSLAVEEQFYFLIPLVLVLLSRPTTERRRIPVLVAFAAASFALSVYGAIHHQSATFYLLPTRTWELLAGCILAASSHRIRPGRPVANETRAWAGMLLILIPCFVYDDHTVFPGLAAAAPVFGTVLVIASGMHADRLPTINRLLARRPFVFVGLISYSLYLWHWPLFVFCRYLQMNPLTTLDATLLVLASVCLAVLSWRFIEVPLRTLNLLQSKRRAAAFASLAFAGLLGAGLAVGIQNGFPERVSPRTLLLVETSQRDPRWNIDLDASDIPDNLASLGADSGQPAELLVWGDSHAMAVLPGIDSLCRKHGIAVVAATHSSTLPVKDYFVKSRGLREQAVEFNDAVLDYARSSGIKAALLVARDWREHLRNSECRNALINTARLLQSDGVRVYLMNTVPEFEFDIARFLALRSVYGGLNELVISREKYESMLAIDQQCIRLLMSNDVHILEPSTVFFDGSDEFRPFDSSGAYYRDSHHLSTHGALAVQSLFEPIIHSLKDGGTLSRELHGIAESIGDSLETRQQ
jgi:peptidoglycan/LPS O-acetylase OafA/YrhL